MSQYCKRLISWTLVFFTWLSLYAITIVAVQKWAELTKDPPKPTLHSFQGRDWTTERQFGLFIATVATGWLVHSRISSRAMLQNETVRRTRTVDRADGDLNRSLERAKRSEVFPVSGVEFTIVGNTTDPYYFPQLIPCDNITTDRLHPCPLVAPGTWPWPNKAVDGPKPTEKNTFFYLAEVFTASQDGAVKPIRLFPTFQEGTRAGKLEQKTYNKDELERSFNPGPGQAAKLVYRPLIPVWYRYSFLSRVRLVREGDRRRLQPLAAPSYTDSLMSDIDLDWIGPGFLAHVVDSPKFLSSYKMILELELAYLTSWVTMMPEVNDDDETKLWVFLLESVATRAKLSDGLCGKGKDSNGTRYQEKVKPCKRCREKNNEVVRLAGDLLKIARTRAPAPADSSNRPTFSSYWSHHETPAEVLMAGQERVDQPTRPTPTSVVMERTDGTRKAAGAPFQDSKRAN
ncbi:hypothetical protein J8273_6420 [Carpediemonas membranifera]|uniref:Uncharacterized protein n=1 Tax=Carpediemonas membranifera TaxID=201153 RepID=A0A8J6AT15_9EUKA|nr:hypothetical protein J8273_6420 [Carpediemonas membranifera]|eukprot:KAG9391655.1 hypothetical protein J8273_6420 [Carpediemonas membranifera]